MPHCPDQTKISRSKESWFLGEGAKEKQAKGEGLQQKGTTSQRRGKFELCLSAKNAKNSCSDTGENFMFSSRCGAMGRIGGGGLRAQIGRREERRCGEDESRVPLERSAIALIEIWTHDNIHFNVFADSCVSCGLKGVEREEPWVGRGQTLELKKKTFHPPLFRHWNWQF